MSDTAEQSGADLGLNKKAPKYALVVLAIYIMVYLLGAIWLFFDGWLNEFKALGNLWGYPSDKSLPSLFKSAINAICGSVMGCGVLGVVSFHRYVSVENNFQIQHLWGYFFAPFLAASIGLISFALLQSGLLVFSGQNQSSSEISNLGYLAVGFLSGYGWYQFTVKVEELIEKFLSAKKRPKLSEKPISESESDATNTQKANKSMQPTAKASAD